MPGTGAIFRRSCFDQIGGYTPLRYGGSDWLVQLDAKMAGWDTMTLPDLHIFHYRPTSSADGIWRGMFRRGLMDASFGSDPVFEFFKCGRRALTRPLGSLVHFGGYLWWNLVGRKPLIHAEKVAFLRREQRAKLQKWAARFGTASEVEPKPTIALIPAELGIELCTRSRRTNGNPAFQHQCGSLHVVGCNESRDVAASERSALMIKTPRIGTYA